MDSLVEFLRDSGGWGVASEVAALFTYGIGLWEHSHDRPIPAFVLLTISVPLFWIGAYVAWSKKRRDNVTLRTRLKSRNPDLNLSIEGLLYQYDPTTDLTVFALSAYLFNAGEASVAMNWGARYLVSASIETMIGYNIYSTYTFRHGDQTVTLMNSNLLQAQTITRRLSRGDAKAGRLIFALPGNRIKQIESLQFSIELECSDFTGKKTVAKFVPDPKPVIGARSYPGEKVQIGRTQPESVSFTPPSLPSADQNS
jgi:hypothetical protein